MRIFCLSDALLALKSSYVMNSFMSMPVRKLKETSWLLAGETRRLPPGAAPLGDWFGFERMPLVRSSSPASTLCVDSLVLTSVSEKSPPKSSLVSPYTALTPLLTVVGDLIYYVRSLCEFFLPAPVWPPGTDADLYSKKLPWLLFGPAWSTPCIFWFRKRKRSCSTITVRRSAKTRFIVSNRRWW